MNNTLKRYILSSSITFLTVFITVFGVNFAQTGDMLVSGSLLAGLSLTALRAAVKAVIEGMSGKTGDLFV